MTGRVWAPAAASLLVYGILTAIIGREVLTQISTAIANDAGDPLLTAAILHWNASHVPGSDAWWQFPIFYPTRDALAFSEHLLGLSVIATPIAWITGHPLTTYNVTLLLTFPLSAMAMYALVYRLTGTALGSFIAGLAFAFAPYRISSLPHIQMLAAFWAPLALLGLHGYVESAGPPSEPVLRPGEGRVGSAGVGPAGTRRWPWLVLYGCAWALQAAANNYALVFFTTTVGLWVLWFVVARRNWRALGVIIAVTALAALPLVPILWKYVSVHAYHGLERGVAEMRMYSADLTAVLCAPSNLTFWGWVRVACRSEGELFPGVAVFAIFVGAMVAALRGSHVALGRRMVAFRRVLLWIAAAYLVVLGVLLAMGPWSIDVLFFTISASSVDKPLLIALAAAVGALLLSLLVHASAPRTSTLGFYLVAAVVTWLLALGPTVLFLGEPTGRPGPFAMLLAVPGANGLRAPARFWLMTVMCMAVVAGLFVTELARARSRAFAAIAGLVIACAVLADGWVDRIAAQRVPSGLADTSMLENGVVLNLPMDPYADIGSMWRAVTGGWRSVNGYSGYEPSYYPALVAAARLEDEAMFAPFQADADLHVVVADAAVGLKALVERQPGVSVTSYGSWATQYRLPRRPRSALPDSGRRLEFAAVRAACAVKDLQLLQDGDERTQWGCGAKEGVHELIVELHQPQRVGAVMYGLGRYHWEYASHMAIETSLDGTAWADARSGSILGELIAAGLKHPRATRAILRFTPREARYLRIRPIQQLEDFRWSIAELEVWSGK